MSITYGRSLPKGPRPKPPQPKLGGAGNPRRKRKKPKPAKTQKVTDTGSSGTRASTQTQKQAKKKNKKRKLERSRQNTLMKVEVVKPGAPSSTNSTVNSGRVVVEWERAGHRYLAWGKRGIKKVEGWKKCTEKSTYNQLLKRLEPIEIKLSIADQRMPVAPILDLIIAAGKVLKPRRIFPPSGGTTVSSLQSRRRSQRRPASNQRSRRLRSVNTGGRLQEHPARQGTMADKKMR